MSSTHPTAYAEVNRVLLELLSDVQTVLGRHFVGMYLFGSLAGGDFDRDSDIDFIVVTNADISDTLFSGLQTAHMRIATIECWCATELEGCYLPRQALRRYIRTDALYPHIDRGKSERLRMKPQDSDWTIHGHILRCVACSIRSPLAPSSQSELQRDGQKKLLVNRGLL
jgi:Nucleotidyltransferase domain